MIIQSFDYSIIFYFSIFYFFYLVKSNEEDYYNIPMTKQQKDILKEEARDMFYHGYRAYMENAYPADELMPLTCAGRYRGIAPNRGDMDDILGNFSLTLIDSLDTLVILGDLEEFQNAVRLIIKDVQFDNDIVVSVFETNIRVLGGLLSGHVLAEYIQNKYREGILEWYNGELLKMAKDLGYRLLPAFNSTTGIPYARINLKYGLNSNNLDRLRETCTACAGTMILEMAALSRLTGEKIFERKAHEAMDQLWKMRHRSSDLMGSILNVQSGDWIRRDSGVGAGIDSYYEYLLKAYILLGDDNYLIRFNRHYDAIMKYVSQGPLLVDVHMHRPNTNSKNFMDALLAFWPGLQVLKGDLKAAMETHEMLYQVMKRHTFIPEAFTTDFQVHWAQYPLRPEFLESTYFLYKATNDQYYLDVGRNVLKSLQKYTRVGCGYAAVNDVRTREHEDRMDSFVLAETFKYLYLLFADDDELLIDLNDFIFTTEAHLLPLSLALSYKSPQIISNYTKRSTEKILRNVHERGGGREEGMMNKEYWRTCPSTMELLPELIRRPLFNMVNGVCPKQHQTSSLSKTSTLTSPRRLTAVEFQINDQQHLKILKDMGITLLGLDKGRIQLLHSFSNAKSSHDAEEGLIFMQEMLELSKVQAQQPEAKPQGVKFISTHTSKEIVLSAGPSHFGMELTGNMNVVGQVVLAHPFRACEPLKNPPSVIKDHIVIMERGDCMFVDKARRIQQLGAIAGIVVDNVAGSSADTTKFFAMSGDGNDDVKIPLVFLFSEEASKLILTVTTNPFVQVTIGQLDYFKTQNDLTTTTTKVAATSLEETIEQLKLPDDDDDDDRLIKENNGVWQIRFRNFACNFLEGIIVISFSNVQTDVTNVEGVKEGGEGINELWASHLNAVLYYLIKVKLNYYLWANEIEWIYDDFNQYSINIEQQQQSKRKKSSSSSRIIKSIEDKIDWYLNQLQIYFQLNGEQIMKKITENDIAAPIGDETLGKELAKITWQQFKIFESIVRRVKNNNQLLTSSSAIQLLLFNQIESLSKNNNHFKQLITINQQSNKQTHLEEEDHHHHHGNDDDDDDQFIIKDEL